MTDTKRLTPQERRDLLQQLFDSVLTFLTETFKDPDNEPSAFLISCTMNFLKMNGIRADKDSQIEKGLEELYDLQLPFDETNDNPMMKPLRTL